MTLTTSFYVVLAFTASAVLLDWVYFHNYQLARPSIGVLNLGDVAFMIGVIILIPYLYLTLPLWLVAAIFAMAMLSILHFVGEPVLRARWATRVVALSLIGADVWTNLYFGATSTPFFLVNNAVLVLAVVGAATMAFLQLAKVEVGVPLMTGLGPLMVVQYGYWVRRQGPERTTWEYLRTEPLDRRRTASGGI